MEHKYDNSSRIFILEDDIWYGSMLEHFLGLDPNNEVFRFESAAEMFANMHLKPNLITVDFSLPDINGDEVLKKLKASSFEAPIIIISGQTEIKTAIALLRDGAYEYIVKDDDAKDRLLKTIQKLNELKKLKHDVKKLQNEVGKKYDFTNAILGKSTIMKKVYDLVDIASKNNNSVSIIGETGTGKDLISKIIHYNSNRRKYPLVEIDIASISAELLESELFGCEKGSFSWATTRKIGKIEEADNGALVINGIEKLNLSVQLKLLKVIQERELKRIGGNTNIPVNIRIISTSSKKLEEAVKNKLFREDLFHSLNEICIELPNLRERENDILLLSKYFIDSFCKENKMNIKTLSQEAQKTLLRYSFPGNVTELRTIMELVASITNEEVILNKHLNISLVYRPHTVLNSEYIHKEQDLHIIQKYLDNNKFSEFISKQMENIDPIDYDINQSEDTLSRNNN